MSSFTAGWLSLREPADRRARSARLARLVGDRLAGLPVNVLDLGAGTGANFRYLATRLPSPQNWRLVDRDPDLLAAAALEHPLVTTGIADLSTLGSHAVLFAGRNLVTASALLDLVSAPWLVELAHFCRECGATVLFALTYDGRFECVPSEAEDDALRTLVNAHQRTDKGFGAALGPTAVHEAAQSFEGEGYEIVRESSDWTLDSAEAELQRQLITGWADAATLVSSQLASDIESWKRRRLEHVDAGRSRLTVGHEDLAGWIR